MLVEARSCLNRLFALLVVTTAVPAAKAMTYLLARPQSMVLATPLAALLIRLTSLRWGSRRTLSDLTRAARVLLRGPWARLCYTCAPRLK